MLRAVRILAAVTMAGLALAAPGCLVLSDPEFQTEDECPPSLKMTEASPNPVAFPILTATTTKAFEFRASVPVDSCALTRALEARVFLDGSLLRSSELPPNGTASRDLTVFVALDSVKQGCHVVEVLVSGRFSSDQRQPAKAGDIGSGVWWFGVQEDATKPLPSITDCDKGL